MIFLLVVFFFQFQRLDSTNLSLKIRRATAFGGAPIHTLKSLPMVATLRAFLECLAYGVSFAFSRRRDLLMGRGRSRTLPLYPRGHRGDLLANRPQLQ